MKKLEFNEFELRRDAVEMLEKVQLEFGGCVIYEEGTDELWAVSRCNGFETIDITYDDENDIYFLEATNIFERDGEEIMEFIKENRNRIS